MIIIDASNLTFMASPSLPSNNPLILVVPLCPGLPLHTVVLRISSFHTSHHFLYTELGTSWILLELVRFVKPAHLARYSTE